MFRSTAPIAGPRPAASEACAAYHHSGGFLGHRAVASIEARAMTAYGALPPLIGRPASAPAIGG
jgi:hypothetical protein